MIEHILLLRWNDKTSQEAIDRAIGELRGLKEKIPGIVDLSSGVNFSERAKGFTHGMIFHFKDRAALEGYIRHPDHQHVVQTFLNPIRADTLVFDYEV
jgi:Stress responsive A/B Barrel Domain